jgi:hypothetical protein
MDRNSGNDTSHRHHIPNHDDISNCNDTSNGNSASNCDEVDVSVIHTAVNNAESMLEDTSADDDLVFSNPIADDTSTNDASVNDASVGDALVNDNSCVPENMLGLENMRSDDHICYSTSRSPAPSNANEDLHGSTDVDLATGPNTTIDRPSSASASSVTISELTGDQTPAELTPPEAERRDASPISPRREQQNRTTSSSSQEPNEGGTARKGTILPTKFEQLKWTFILYMLTLLLLGLLFFYIHAALVSQDTPLGPLLLDPSKTVLLISALSQSFVILLESLLDSVFNYLRWQLAASDTGVLASTFLGLSKGTSLWGVAMLMRRGIHITWGIHRYVYVPLFDLCSTNTIQASDSSIALANQHCP